MQTQRYKAATWTIATARMQREARVEWQSQIANLKSQTQVSDTSLGDSRGKLVVASSPNETEQKIEQNLTEQSRSRVERSALWLASLCAQSATLSTLLLRRQRQRRHFELCPRNALLELLCFVSAAVRCVASLVARASVCKRRFENHSTNVRNKSSI